MRTRLGFSVGSMLGIIAGLSLAGASIAADEKSTETVSELATNSAEPTSESVTAQIEELATRVHGNARRALELLVRSNGVKEKRPRAKEKEDAAALAQRQKDLAQWVSDIEAMRSELKDHQAQLDANSDRIQTIRKLDMTDKEVTKLVNLELGTQNVAIWLRRGMRDLDRALRRGANALDERVD